MGGGVGNRTGGQREDRGDGGQEMGEWDGGGEGGREEGREGGRKEECEGSGEREVGEASTTQQQKTLNVRGCSGHKENQFTPWRFKFKYTAG